MTGSDHTAILVARGAVPDQPTGPIVADELTRNLREPYKTIIREQYVNA